MLPQHAHAKRWFGPGDVFPLGPGRRGYGAPDQLVQSHWHFAVSLPAARRGFAGIRPPLSLTCWPMQRLGRVSAYTESLFGLLTHATCSEWLLEGARPM